MMNDSTDAANERLGQLKADYVRQLREEHLKLLCASMRIEARANEAHNTHDVDCPTLEELQATGTTNVRAQVNAMLRDKLAARRLRAALLLQELDDEAGRRALEAMQQDQSPLHVFYGDEIEVVTVGSVIPTLLTDQPMCFIPNFPQWSAIDPGAQDVDSDKGESEAVTAKTFTARVKKFLGFD